MRVLSGSASRACWAAVFGFVRGVSLLPALGEKLVGLADPAGKARHLGRSLHGGEQSGFLTGLAGLLGRSFCLFL